MEKQRRMAFGFRKTATAVQKTGQIDRWMDKKGNYFSPFHNVQNVSRIQTAIYQIGTVRSLLRVKQPALN